MDRSPVDRLQPASVHSGGGRGQMLGFPMARVLLVSGHRALGRQPLTLAHNLVKIEAAEYSSFQGFSLTTDPKAQKGQP